MGKVFISHASADKPIIDELVTLLTNGVGLPLSEIFCTSLDGLGISAGDDIALKVATAINETEVCILILSPNYYASYYCLAEMGAIWIKQKDVLLLKVDTLKSDDPGVFFPGRKLVSFDKSGLAQIYDRLKSIKGFSAATVGRWQIRLDLFLSKYSEVIKNIKAPSLVNASEHQKVIDSNKELLTLARENEEKIAKQDLLIGELKKAKDRSEVAAVMSRHTGAGTRYEELSANLRTAMSHLPPIVKDVLYSNERGMPFADDLSREELRTAEERTLISYTERFDQNGYWANSEHPKIKQAEDAIRELSTFLLQSSDFVNELTEQLGYPANLVNKDFWNRITK